MSAALPGATPAAMPDRRDLAAALAVFQTPSTPRAAWQATSTAAAYLAVNAAMYAAAAASAWLVLPLAVLAGGLIVRLFIVQHDCGHGSFFRSRALNDAVGRLCSVFTFTPYAFWRRQHAVHHASFNNLDRRDPGIDLYSSCTTVREYQALSPRRRLVHRLTRHPAVTQLLLPPLVFLLVYRVPFDAPRSWRKERRSVVLTNLVLAAVLGTLVAAFGWRSVALVQGTVVAVAAVVGVWLFTIQHRFEGAVWSRQEDWSHLRASLEGSSYLKLPRVLQWFTGNIGFHHVHHLSARVPNYRLQACHAARPELHGVTTLTLRQALRASCLALWDEERQAMVPFPRAAGLRR